MRHGSATCVRGPLGCCLTETLSRRGSLAERCGIAERAMFVVSWAMLASGTCLTLEPLSGSIGPPCYVDKIGASWFDGHVCSCLAIFFMSTRARGFPFTRAKDFRALESSHDCQADETIVLSETLNASGSLFFCLQKHAWCYAHKSQIFRDMPAVVAFFMKTVILTMLGIWNRREDRIFSQNLPRYK